MKGIMPQLLRNLIKDEELLTNGSPINVTAAWVVIFDTKTFNLSAGDWVLAGMYLNMLKGGVTGPSGIYFQRLTGTATLTFLGRNVQGWDIRNVTYRHSTACRWYPRLFLPLHVTVGGTYQFRLWADSDQSDSTIAAGDALMQTLVFR